ncbi:MAG: hypothetical protein ACXV3V_10965 [Actinomycetes bacterium]
MIDPQPVPTQSALEQPLDYWTQTDHLTRLGTDLDRLAARQVNAANATRDAEPFGSLPLGGAA